MLHVRGDGTIGFCKCRMNRRHQGIISENVASRNRTDSGMIAPPVMDGGSRAGYYCRLNIHTRRKLEDDEKRRLILCDYTYSNYSIFKSVQN